MKENLVKLAQKHGTSLFIIDHAKIRQKFREDIRQAIREELRESPPSKP